MKLYGIRSEADMTQESQSSKRSRYCKNGIGPGRFVLNWIQFVAIGPTTKRCYRMCNCSRIRSYIVIADGGCYQCPGDVAKAIWWRS